MASTVAEAGVRRLMESLPPVKEIQLRAWNLSFGGDYYGALHLAAHYCGLSEPPAHFPGAWQHGTIPPWHMFCPEVVVYDAPRSARCFVAREDEAELLRKGGYRKASAIGLPLIYTQPSGLRRMPNSLLVMPTHSLPSDLFVPSCSQYVCDIASIGNRFDTVVACVSANCMQRGLWGPQFGECGIPVVRGAGISDGNALWRMRALFDSFEYVTTDSYGSHVFYALYCGAKVSIWGTPTPALRENVLRDGGWTAYPNAVEKMFAPETEQHADSYLGPLRTSPWMGVNDPELGKRMLGEENKLTPEELRRAFGWTGFNAIRESAIGGIRKTPLWRIARATKHVCSRDSSIR